MLTFEELTPTGRLRRLRSFAVEVAVECYGLQDPRVRLLSKHSFNTMFRVDCAAGRFVLRVGDQTRIHSEGVEEVEAQWLCRLAENTTINAPVPIHSQSDKWRVDYESESVPGARACSMFTFIEGQELRATNYGSSAMFDAGALLARLHKDASGAPPPANETDALRCDRVVYFHDENLVNDFQSNAGQMFSEAVDRVQSAIDDLWKNSPHEPHLLHGDFGAHNIMTWRSKLRAIDFQDLQIGFDIQDLAITLGDLNRNTPELTEPFRNGYQSIRPMPEMSPSLLAALGAGRSLNMMNLGLHLRREGIDQFLKRHSQLVETWMRDGR